MIVIINYGVGNILSVKNAVLKSSKEVKISNSLEDILNARRIILPGVGSFGEAIKNLEEWNLKEVIIEKIKAKTPILGICLGMQILFEESEEANGVKGLGVFKGKVIRFPEIVKIPHMGWNNVILKDKTEFFNQKFFYFAHSYFCLPEEKEIIFGETQYGIKFPSIVKNRNILGVQFHPEKSGKIGLEFLRRWLKC